MRTYTILYQSDTLFSNPHRKTPRMSQVPFQVVDTGVYGAANYHNPGPVNCNLHWVSSTYCKGLLCLFSIFLDILGACKISAICGGPCLVFANGDSLCRYAICVPSTKGDEPHCLGRAPDATMWCGVAMFQSIGLKASHEEFGLSPCAAILWPSELYRCKPAVEDG